MRKQDKHFYEFGPFRIDPAERLLLRGEEVIPLAPKAIETDRKSTRLNSSHIQKSRMPSSA